jgi:hypothetical protein
MIAGNEKSLRSAWRLLALKDDALAEIDVTPEGFRRSWLALPLTLPFVLLGIAASNLVDPDKTPLVPAAIFLAVSWLVGVGGVVFFGFLTRRSEKLTAAITVLNWFGLWANMIFILPRLFFAAGMPLNLMSALSQIMLFYFTLVQGLILWRLWRIPLVLAAGIAISLMIIDQYTGLVFRSLVHPQPAVIDKAPARS